MIDLQYWPTRNGHKITLMLEECDLPYRIVPVDITAGAQLAPARAAEARPDTVPTPAATPQA